MRVGLRSGRGKEERVGGWVRERTKREGWRIGEQTGELEQKEEDVGREEDAARRGGTRDAAGMCSCYVIDVYI